MAEEQRLRPSRWRIRLPSSTAQLPQFRERLRRLLRPLNLADSTVHDIVLSTHEAVVNGMVHGNRLDARKAVTVTVELGGPGVVIRVADEGPGFGWRSWLRRLQRQSLDPQALEGRGLLLISRLMDGVCFSDPGNVVRLTKRLTDASS